MHLSVSTLARLYFHVSLQDKSVKSKQIVEEMAER